MMNNSKKVQWDDRPPRSRDSALGSSSSGQVGTGGRPDRRFTETDRADQRYNVRALQEALDAANKSVEHCKKRNLDLDQQLSKSRKELKESQALWKSQVDRNEVLQEQNNLLTEQYHELKEDYNVLRDDRDEWRQRLLSQPPQPVEMTSAISSDGSHSSAGLGRTKSKRHESRDLTDRGVRDRLKQRIEHKEEELTTKPRGRRQSVSRHNDDHASSKGHHHHRRASVSRPSVVTTEPYIENMGPGAPRPPIVSIRHYDNFSTTPQSPYVQTSNVPRTTERTIPSHLSTAPYRQESGDYVQYPLPDKKHRGHN